MARYQLHRTQLIPRPLHEVFKFFSDAQNLEKLTPGFLHFRIMTPQPIVMKPGALIDYRLRLYGWPVSWQTRIESFIPDESFVDRQLHGPYRHWEHRHEFRAVPDGTEMIDHVEYQLPFGVLGQLARTFFVRRALENIFDFRHKTVEAEFGAA